MTFGLPQPRMAGSRFFPAPTKSPVIIAIERGRFDKPNQALVRLVEAALATPPSDGPPASRAAAYAILRQVASEHGVDVPSIFGRRRFKRAAEARQQAMWLVWRRTGMSLSAIGRFFHRDHSTVHHAIRKCEAALVEKTVSLAAPKKTAPTIRVVNE